MSVATGATFDAVLLDTHALLWWWLDDPRLTAVAKAAIADPDRRVLVSAASFWEISTKHRLGKLGEVGDLLARVDEYLRVSRFDELPITRVHALRAGAFEHAHRDPFDRMLAAQSISESTPIITGDDMIRVLGAEVVW